MRPTSLLLICVVLVVPGCTWTRYMLELRRQERQPYYDPEPSHGCIQPDGSCEYIRPSRCDGVVLWMATTCDDPCLCVFIDGTCDDLLPADCHRRGGDVTSCRVTCAEVDGTGSVTFAECVGRAGE